MGTPNEKTWPGVTKLPDYKKTLPQFAGKDLEAFCPNLDDEGVDLLRKMITLDPYQRISAKEALQHV